MTVNQNYKDRTLSLDRNLLGIVSLEPVIILQ